METPQSRRSLLAPQAPGCLYACFSRSSRAGQSFWTLSAPGLPTVLVDKKHKFGTSRVANRRPDRRPPPLPLGASALPLPAWRPSVSSQDFQAVYRVVPGGGDGVVVGAHISVEVGPEVVGDLACERGSADALLRVDAYRADFCCLLHPVEGVHPYLFPRHLRGNLPALRRRDSGGSGGGGRFHDPRVQGDGDISEEPAKPSSQGEPYNRSQGTHHSRCCAGAGPQTHILPSPPGTGIITPLSARRGASPNNIPRLGIRPARKTSDMRATRVLYRLRGMAKAGILGSKVPDILTDGFRDLRKLFAFSKLGGPARPPPSHP